MSDDRTAAAGGSGIGLIGLLIILGILGMGPCAGSCQGCGPTLGDVLHDAQCADK